MILRVGFGLLALLFAFAVHGQGQIRPQAPVPLPTPFTPIVDYANVIDADTRQRLEAIYLNLKDRGGIVFAVLTVQTTGEQDIFDYSLAVARGWGIGPPDAQTPSFLLVVAIQDRKYFTQVSQHLEGELPDGLVGQIQRERLVPAFKQSNYSKGIYDTVQANIATIAAKRGFSIEGIDQRYAYRGDGERQPSFQIRQSRGSLTTVCCGIVVVVFVLMLIAGASRGGRGGGGRGGRGGWGRRGGFGGGGLLEALLWGSVLGNLTGGGRGGGSSSGWGSSGGFGGGGFGGGGSGGFGGGFGGGDSFGGGGAGGSW